MAELYLHKRKVDSVFQLVGEHENDITRSLAWALSQGPSFLRQFLYKAVDVKVYANDVIIRLQQHEKDGGITDIELESPQFYVIVEAKRGWNLPSSGQLKKYAERSSFKESRARFKRLVAISECSPEYAELHLEICKVAGVTIQPVSWKDVAILATKAQSEGTYAEKRLMRELLTYLRGLMTMQKLDSNLVYVVSLARGTPVAWGISWIDIVEKRRLYFHPVGGSGWPKEPPNYIALRYYGKLQSIHHIEGYKITTNMHKRIPEIPNEEWGPHFLYTLGPPFCPNKEVRTGNIYPNGRVWCMLDTLFTCDTISAARDLSRERLRLETQGRNLT